MRIIINADDLGKNSLVNHDIFGLMARRLVTSATILANGPALEECLDHIASYPHCSFGIHLNITEFKPLNSSPALNKLLDARGEFCLEKFKKTRFDLDLKEAISEEWSCQVKKLQSFNLNISHIDSHHDVHTDPRLFLILKRIQKIFAIRKVRIAANLSPDPDRRYLKNRLLNTALRHFYFTKMTSGFAEFSTFLEAAQKHPLPYSTVELAVHPGHPKFTEETRALQTPWEKGLPFPVQLISYNDL